MPSGSYTAISLSQAITALADRLSDISLVRWTAAELGVYLGQALRTWNAFTHTYRATTSFNTNNSVLNTNTPFFDLPTLTPALRGYTVLTDDAINLLQYHLLEGLTPSGSTSWRGTDQFSYLDLLNALQRRRDQFLLETSQVVTRATMPVAFAIDGRVALPESIVSLRRLAWTTLAGVVTPLKREDEWSANAYQPAWNTTTASSPRMVSVAATRPLYAQLMPPPDDTGTLDYVAVVRGTPLAPGVTLGIPDDWTWVVIFGALADLLGRDGLALDVSRAAYCEQRWQHGIQLAKAAAVVVTARINNQVVRLGALPDLDAFNPAWQTATAQPTRAVTIGQNLIAFAPVPSAHAPSGWSVTLDLVANMPVPASPSAYLQIGPEQIDSILDYAQHLALFKEGAAELGATQELLQRFMRAAGVDVQWQQALQPARKPLLGQTSQDRRGPAPAHIDSADDATQPVAPGSTL